MIDDICTCFVEPFLSTFVHLGFRISAPSTHSYIYFLPHLIFLISETSSDSYIGNMMRQLSTCSSHCATLSYKVVDLLVQGLGKCVVQNCP